MATDRTPLKNGSQESLTKCGWCSIQPSKMQAKRRNHLEWLCFKRFLKGKKYEQERLWELKFMPDRKEFRLVGRFGWRNAGNRVLRVLPQAECVYPKGRYRILHCGAQKHSHRKGQDGVNERSKMISKLIKGRDTRASYIRSK